MIIEDKVKVGKKGEILPKKTLRELSGIKPGDEVIIEAHPGELIIKKIYTMEELLDMPIISEGTAESVEKDIEEEVKKQIEMTNNEH
ncbi:MAG: AbrB/MazE/SpoVT family DNA-binding domain-containing protein [Promethearchaeota archaeon]|nr:MAG: AbrB/MazE/SpoVT family DNA-binding domain-containing protein [Candidatus Lokiarchaeota archaeon]